MKFNSEESIKVLKYALSKEKAANLFYADKSQTLLDSPAKIIFKDLAQDEHKHMEIISALLQQAESGAAQSTTPPSPPQSPKQRVESIFSKFKGSALTEKTTAIEALTYALGIEKLSFEHYSQAVKDSENSETAAVYSFLAGEENKHYIIIKNALDFIDDPGRWLYEEENLIFRL